MPRTLAILVALVAVNGAATGAGAQVMHAMPPVRPSAAAGALLQGIVTDDLGHAVVGASVVALGSTLGVATSDGVGHFQVMLPPGIYVLRAVRSGYVSTYRESVRLETDSSLERHITLTREAVLNDPVTGDTAPAAVPSHQHGDAAWYLRHLPRTVLRDEDPWTAFGATAVPDPPSATLAGRGTSAWAPSPDLGGEVNLLTTGALGAASGLPAAWSRNAANLSFSAPMGNGDWAFRSAMSGDGLSFWSVAADYAADHDNSHAFDVGLSYGAETIATGSDSVGAVAAAPLSRVVGGLSVTDRWHVRPGVELDYGSRLDHYDYLTDPDLVSPDVAGRIALFPAVSLVAGWSDDRVAPGADQFLPPASAGPWLPPEWNFSAFGPDGLLSAEAVEKSDLGFEVALGSTHSTLGIRRVSESTDRQFSTLFGLGGASDLNGYEVAVPGDVDLTGWAVRWTGHLGAYLSGTAEYFAGEGLWHDEVLGDQLALEVPSAVRPGRERLEDLRMFLEGTIPHLDTHITFAFRGDDAFAGATATTPRPVSAGRFDLEVRQHLPYRRLDHGRVNLVFSVRTLLRDISGPGGFYDELLTVAPPVRVTGGFQVWF